MKRLNHSSETLRASAPFVVLPLAAQQISSSRFSILSVCGHLAFLPAPAHAVLPLRFAAQLRRTSTPYLPSIEFA
jgi:hypothetical protein